MNTEHRTRRSLPHLSQTDQVILFDGVCRLCNGWSQFIITYDKEKKFKLAALQSPEGQDILSALGLPTDQFGSIVYIENNQAYQKSDAVLGIVKHLPFPWNWFYALHIIPKALRDWFYDRIAANRYALFGSYDQCMMPSAETRDRFLGNGST